MSDPQAAIQRGFLVLADISGYTSFLSHTELDHAQEILSELLETILQHLRPVLAIHKIEGDAVFAHSAGSSLARGEALLDLIEAAYAGFRDRLQNVRRHTTCTCRACQSAPMLDLKARLAVLWEWFNDPARRSQWQSAEIAPVLRVGRAAGQPLLRAQGDTEQLVVRPARGARRGRGIKKESPARV